MRIRQFLIDTFTLYQRPFNWLIDRWNFCRYHVLPLHTYYNVQYFGVPSRPHHPHRNEVTVWGQSIGIWENDQGEIVAVAHSENEEAGEAWVQIHPNYTFLYDEIVTYVEENLANIVDGLGYVKLYIKVGFKDMGHGYAPWIKYFDATKPTQISTSLLSRPSL